MPLHRGKVCKVSTVGNVRVNRYAEIFVIQIYSVAAIVQPSSRGIKPQPRKLKRYYTSKFVVVLLPSPALRTLLTIPTLPTSQSLSAASGLSPHFNLLRRVEKNVSSLRRRNFTVSFVASARTISSRWRVTYCWPSSVRLI